jgi:hypothetical protein
MSKVRSILDYLLNIKRDYVRQGLTTSAPKVFLESGEYFTFNYDMSSSQISKLGGGDRVLTRSSSQISSSGGDGKVQPRPHRCSLNRFGQPKSLEMWIPEGSLAEKLDSFRSTECERLFEHVRVKKLSRVILSEGDIDVQATAEALMNKLKSRESTLALAS